MDNPINNVIRGKEGNEEPLEQEYNMRPLRHSMIIDRWRRNPITVLQHIVLTVVVFVAIMMITGIISSDVQVAPVKRRTKHAPSKRSDHANAPARMINVEVLGENEAARLGKRHRAGPERRVVPEPQKNVLLPGDIPVPRLHMQQMNSLGNVRQNEIANDFRLLPHDSENPDTSNRRANVLIVAAMRTGSSFVGELFQQREDFFYMFEPGMILMQALDSLNLTRRVMVSKLIEMLNEFFQCKFRDVKFFIDALNLKSLHSRKLVVPALVTKQFCRNRDQDARRQDVCDPVTERLLETACSSRQHTAIKTIRILDINLMLSAIERNNIKMIHLVRDPRSMIVSRLRLKHPGISVFNLTHYTSTVRNNVVRYCSNWLQNFEVGHYMPAFVRNYLMLRYEDVALQPYKSARLVYEFVGVGIGIPASVRMWLQANTYVDDERKKKLYAFSTKRDSRSVIVGWKSRIDVDVISAIESVDDCRELMKLTGYRLVDGNSTLLGDQEDHLVMPLPRPPHSVTDFMFF